MNAKKIFLSILFLGPIAMMAVFIYGFTQTNDTVLKVVLVIGILYCVYILLRGIKYIVNQPIDNP